MHDFLRKVPEIGRDAALAECTHKEYALCEAIDFDELDTLQRGAFAREIAFAYDSSTDSARELARNVTKRDYSRFDLKPFEIPGTADLFGLMSATTGKVGDYKTGWTEVPPARFNRQLQLLAIMCARTFGLTSIVGEIIRIREDGSTWKSRWQWGMFELDEIAEDFRALHLRVAKMRQLHADGERLPVVLGEHCKYCPAMSHCPEHLAIAKRIGTDDQRLELEQKLQAMTPQEAGILHMRLKAHKRLVAMAERTIYAMAKQDPIPLPDGRMLGEITKPGKEKVDGRVAWKVMLERYGHDVAAKAAEMKASKASIDRALALVELEDGQTKKARKAEIVADIKRHGGIEKKPTTTVTEYDPKELGE